MGGRFVAEYARHGLLTSGRLAAGLGYQWAASVLAGLEGGRFVADIDLSYCPDTEYLKCPLEWAGNI